MKKRLIVFVTGLTAACMLSGCCVSHEWLRASCQMPMTCVRCGETRGEVQGHIWMEATCERAKHCGSCGIMEGQIPGHSWVDITCEEPRHCSVCHVTDGEAMGHKMAAKSFHGAEKEDQTHYELYLKNVCEYCGMEQTESMEPQTFINVFLVGRWEADDGSICSFWKDMQKAALMYDPEKAAVSREFGIYVTGLDEREIRIGLQFAPTMGVAYVGEISSETPDIMEIRADSYYKVFSRVPE